MVGFNPDADFKLTKSDYVTAGALSSAIARAVGQPLDVLKIRFQLQIEPTFKGQVGSKYHGVYQAFKTIMLEEGVRALWKGHMPAQLLSVGYGVVQYTAFEYTTAQVWHLLPAEYTTKLRPLTHTVCGGISACLATAAIQPLDMLRTRFVAQGEPKVYRSTFHAVQSILRSEGVWSFYRGLGPAMLCVGPQMGLQFGLYAAFQGIWNLTFRLPLQHHPGYVESLVCGSGSGVVAKLVVYPMDLIKKRLQIQGFQEARVSFGAFRQYSGLVHCLSDVFKEEGILGLYKGLMPSLLKAAVVSGTMFCVYDQTCYFLSLRHR